MKTLSKTAVGTAFMVFMGMSSFGQSKWKVDNVHSGVKFTVEHMMISEVEGSFKTYNGTINAPGKDFNDAQIEFTVDVNSINTDNEMRDKHLKSDDFFNAEKFPVMTFKSTSFKKVSENKYQLTGMLTIRDVTKKVIFDVTYGGTRKDPYGNVKSGFKTTLTINRQDYNLKWTGKTEAGELVVADNVEMQLRLEFLQVP